MNGRSSPSIILPLFYWSSQSFFHVFVSHCLKACILLWRTFSGRMWEKGKIWNLWQKSWRKWGRNERTVWFFLGRGKWSVPSPIFPCLTIQVPNSLMIGKSIHLVLLSVMCAIFLKLSYPSIPHHYRVTRRASSLVESGWVWWSLWQTLIEIWDTRCSPFPKIFHQPHGMSDVPSSNVSM